MNGEGTLNTNAEGNLADGEGLANACTLAANDEALEDLDTVVLTFNDLNVNVQGVTGPNAGMSSRRDFLSRKSRVCIVVDLQSHLPQVK